MTTAERIKQNFDRLPVQTDGTRNFMLLNFVAETAERIAKRTETTHAGITFTFRDASTLTYNARNQTASTTKPIDTAALFAARNYIMDARSNRRRPCAA